MKLQMQLIILNKNENVLRLKQHHYQDKMKIIRRKIYMYVSVTIHDLVPTGDYDFGVQSANSCAGGEVVLAVVEDDYSPRTFMFSWIEIIKNFDSQHEKRLPIRCF